MFIKVKNMLPLVHYLGPQRTHLRYALRPFWDSWGFSSIYFINIIEMDINPRGSILNAAWVKTPWR